jgi:hypothetical protein
MEREMKPSEALEKIEEINAIVKSSNRILFSGRMMMAIGGLCLAIPLIGWGTQWLTFGHDFGSHEELYVSLANAIFFSGLGFALFRIYSRVKGIREVRQATHPLIRRAFSVSVQFWVAFIGLAVVFAATGQVKYLYPINYVLIGLLYSTFGKFTNPAVSLFAWSYILGGLLCFWLASFLDPWLYEVMLAYQALSFLALGGYLLKKEKSHA